MPHSCCSRSAVLLLALLLQASVEVCSRCLERSQCQDLTTESTLWECIQACKSDLSAERPVFTGNGEEQPLTENPRKYVMGHFRWDRFGRRNGSSGGSVAPKREEELATGEGDDVLPAGGPRPQRSHSMEHFRWGKPMGWKRRPVKLFPNGTVDRSVEVVGPKAKRWLAKEQSEATRDPEGPDDGAAIGADLDYGLVAESEMASAEKKDDGPYRMEHFRWGSPPKDKRYGGFMSSEKGQTPLVTLFKNAIIKNAHSKGQ